MTIREVFEAYEIKANKKGVPAIYLEDFLVIFKDAVQDHMNRLYSKFETSQQLSDDLQNLHRHIIIDLYSDLPFPLNITYHDGTPFVQFYSEQILPSLGSGSTFLQTPVQCVNSGGYTNISTFTSNITSNIVFTIDGSVTNPTSELHRLEPFDSNNDSMVIGTILKIRAINGGAARIYSYKHCDGFPTNDYSFDLNGNDSVIINDNTDMFFTWNGTVFILLDGSAFIKLDDLRILLYAPNNYWHLLGFSNVLEVKNNVDCEESHEIKIGVGKLTSEREVSIESNAYLEPKAKRPYYTVKNNFNSEYPNFELHYRKRNEIELVRLTKVEMLYLKEPKIYTMEDDDLDGVDTTENLEFQEYICQELVDTVSILIFEQNSDQRVGSSAQVNESNSESRGTQGNVQPGR